MKSRILLREFLDPARLLVHYSKRRRDDENIPLLNFRNLLFEDAFHLAPGLFPILQFKF
jgi:hypothetical protein